jgi:uncharacterized protein
MSNVTRRGMTRRGAGLGALLLAFNWAYPAAAEPASLPLAERLNAAALERTRHQVTYDPAYVRLAYPGGDVAADRGVCADVVIRAYRAVGIDLQRLVHEDMVRAFSRYPDLWGLSRPDRNIDHRRVPNLETFFRRHGRVLPVSRDPRAYRPGDLVSWRLPDGRPHIGIVATRVSADGTPLVVHNIGAGPRLEDRLFDFAIAGHFRYGPGR